MKSTNKSKTPNGFLQSSLYNIYRQSLLGTAIALAVIVIINPDARLNIEISHIGGIFLRSALIFLTTAYLLEHQHKLISIPFLTGSYSLHELIINTPLFIITKDAYTPTLIVREIFTVVVIALLIAKKFIKPKLTISLMATIAYMLMLYSIFPAYYFLGEGYIPKQFMPQLLEFLYQPLSLFAFLSLMNKREDSKREGYREGYRKPLVSYAG